MSINNLEDDATNNSQEINKLIDDLNSYYLGAELDFNALYKHKDIIFSNSSISLNQILKRLLNAEFSQTSEEIEIQGKLLEIALSKGATINNSNANFIKAMADPQYAINALMFSEDSFFEIKYNSLLNHHRILLNHPTNPISAIAFLKSTLVYPVEKYVSMVGIKPIAERIESQKKLIELALNKGEKFNSLDSISISLDNLYYHGELLFNHQDIEIYARVARLVALKDYGDDKTEFIKKATIIELIESKLGNEADKILSLPLDPFLIKVLELRNIIGKSTLVKLILKRTKINTDQFSESISENEFNDLKNVLELYINDIDFDNISFDAISLADQPYSIQKLLLENGLDARVALMQSFAQENSLDLLKLAIKHNAEIHPFNFFLAISGQNIDPQIYELIIRNISFDLNQRLSLEEIFDDYLKQGKKFNEHIAQEKFVKAPGSIFENNSSIIHMLVKADKKVLIELTLNLYEIDVNILDDLGRSSLFFAKSPEVVEILIHHKADLSIKDKQGKSWIANPDISLFEYLIKNHYLDRSNLERLALEHFSKGNYEHSMKLYKAGFSSKIDIISETVSAITNSLDSSIEINKYQAILNLIDKAGIIIPNEFHYLRNTYRDDYKAEEFKFIYGLLHKLAKYYIDISKTEFKKTISSDGDLDSSDLNEVNQSSSYYKINDSFDVYYQIAGKALNMLDNDFTLEVLTLNGLRPDQLNQGVTVFRGMKANLSPEDIDSYFKYGHRSYSVGDYQKTLGFYVDQPWNSLDGKWEYGGTYTSLQASWAVKFANGHTTSLEAEGIIMEIKLSSNYPKVCGSSKSQSELIIGNIPGESIVAIYKIEKSNGNNKEVFKVKSFYKNPYLYHDIGNTFNENDEINENPSEIKAYEQLGCKELPTIWLSINKSLKYSNYIDFIERFTPEIYVAEQDKLQQDYFVGRGIFEDEFHYSITGACDLEVQCCI